MKKVIVTTADRRAAGVCWRGARRFLSDNGFDPKVFLSEGIDADELEKTGDSIALRVVEVARGRQQ